MYLADMAHTKYVKNNHPLHNNTHSFCRGHVSAVSHGEWHPTEKNILITSAQDSTVRIWDATNPNQQKTVLKFKDAKGKPKLAVTTCAYSRDGNIIAASGEDGSLWLWSATGPYNRPQQVFYLSKNILCYFILFT